MLWASRLCGGREMTARGTTMKLNVKAFALASGLILGLGLFVITWFIIALDGASGEITVISRVCRGYNISPVGSLIGLIWGLVDGAVGGAVFAWLYNSLAGCAPKAEEAAPSEEAPPADEA